MVEGASDLYELRSAVRDFTGNPRTRGCGITPVAVDVGFRVAEVERPPSSPRPGLARAHGAHEHAREASPFGILQCNRDVCPPCGAAKRAKWATRAALAIEQGELSHKDKAFYLVTFTLAHDSDMPIAWLRKGFAAAYRRFRQSRDVHAFFSLCRTCDQRRRHCSCGENYAPRVAGTARALECPHGQYGWHPHYHVLMLSAPCSLAEREMLRGAWHDAVVKELGPQCAPNESVGIVWSEPRDRSKSAANYLSKLGLELSAVSGKKSKKGSRTHLQLARDASKGDLHARKLWQEYETAMRGARVLEMSDTFAAWAKEAEAKQTHGRCPHCGAAIEPGKDHDCDAYRKEHPEHPRGPVHVHCSWGMLKAVRHAEKKTPAVTRQWREAFETEGEFTEHAIYSRVEAWARFALHVDDLVLAEWRRQRDAREALEAEKKKKRCGLPGCRICHDTIELVSCPTCGASCVPVDGGDVWHLACSVCDEEHTEDAVCSVCKLLDVVPPNPTLGWWSEKKGNGLASG